MDLHRAAIALVLLGPGCGSDGGGAQASASGSASASGGEGTTGGGDDGAPGSSGGGEAHTGGVDEAGATAAGTTTGTSTGAGADTSSAASSTGDAGSTGADSSGGAQGSTGEGGSTGGELADGVLDVAIIAHDDCTFTVTPASITVPTGTEFTVNWVSSPASAVEFDVAKIDAFNAVPIILGLEPGGSYHDEIRVWCGDLFTGTFDFELTSCFEPTYIPVDCGG